MESAFYHIEGGECKQFFLCNELDDVRSVVVLVNSNSNT